MQDYKIQKIYPIILAALFLSAFFVLARPAQASTLLDGTANTGGIQSSLSAPYNYTCPYNPNNGMECQAGAYRPIYFLGSQPDYFPQNSAYTNSTGKLSKITVHVGLVGADTTGTIKMQAIAEEIANPNHAIYPESDSVDISTLASSENGTAYTEVAFVFTADSTVDFSSYSILAIGIIITGHLTGYNDLIYDFAINADNTPTYWLGYNSYANHHTVPYLKIEDDAGAGGGDSGSNPGPAISMSADPASIASGGSATISWTSTDATSCDVNGNSGTSGSFSTGSLAETTSYSGTCTGPGGFASGTVTVTVEEASPPSEPSGLRPVVIIPGIMGSELYDGQDFIWPNVGLLIDRVHDYFLLDSLSLDENGDSIKDISLGNIVKKVPTVDTFEKLINDLESKNYVLNDNYFLFPYDWRLNLDDSIDLLKNKIEAIKSQTGFFKVDIVAHSMGGLLAEDYVHQFGADNLNKMIFVGTPHLGAPKSAKVLLEGDIGIPFNLVNQETIKQLSLNSPSVYELLPRQKYFDIYQGYLELQGASLALLPYNSTRLFLKNQKLNSNLIDQAEIFFAKDLADVNFGSAKVYNIAGCALATQATYSFSSSKNHITSTGYGSGDGTVPLVSADYVSGGSNSKYYAKGVKHSEMPSNGAVRQLILGILGDNVLPNSKISDSSGFCNFQGQQLIWKSPVAVHIYDQFGNHAGPTADGGFENNLTGVDYEIIAGEKFIYIPSNDGNTYTIQGIGEATGTFDLVISTIDNGNVTLSVVYNDVNITQASQVTVDVSEAQSSVEFDFDGDGTFGSLASDSSVTGEAVNDRTPPVTSSVESGSNFGPKQITLTATDDNSGVSKIKYSLDNVSFYDYNDPIVISRADNYAVYYYAIDNAGNDEAMNTASVIIDVEPRRASLEYFTPPVILETPTTETPAETPKDQGQVLGEIKTVTIRDSALVLDTTDGRTVYIIGNNGQKFGFTSERVFRDLGYAFVNVIPADLSSFQLGGLVESADASHPNGSLVINNGIIWYINHGLRSAFPSLEVFNSLGFNLNQVVPTNDFDLKLEEQIIN